MANLASHMTPTIGSAPDFVSRAGKPEQEEVHPEVSGISTKIYHHLGVDTPFDPQHRLVTSYILPVPALALIRLVIAIYMLVTAFATAVVEGIGSITYFTSLSYWGDTTYFLMSAIHTCSFWYSLRRWKLARTESLRQGSSRFELLEKAYPLDGVQRIEVSHGKVPIQALGTPSHTDIERELSYSHGTEFEIGARYPRSMLSSRFSRPFQLCHTLLISTVSSFPLVVTVIFWSVLRGPTPLSDPYSIFANVGKHTLNYVLTMLDLILLSRTPLRPWWHMLLVATLLALYLGIVEITYRRYHVWVYAFFNAYQFGTPLVVLFCLVLGVFAVASFLLTQLLMLGREVLAAKVQRSGGWGSAKAVGVPDDACIPTIRGPGPLGGGARRAIPGHDAIHLRGRFPHNALPPPRSRSTPLNVPIQTHSTLNFKLNMDETKSLVTSGSGANAPTNGRTTLDMPNPDASSSEAHLFRPVNWTTPRDEWA